MVLPENNIQRNCDDSGVGRILGISGTLVTAALIAVCFRIWVRATIVRCIGLDDWTMIAAIAMAIGTFICFIGEAQHGVHQRPECITSPNLLLKWLYFHSIWITTGMAFVKVSIACFLLRLAPQKWCKWLLRASVVLVVSSFLVRVGTIMFAHKPVSAFWNVQSLSRTTRVSYEAIANIGLFHSIINICVDVLFALVPISIVRKLEVSPRRKLILMAVLGMSMGLVASVAAAVKLYWQSTFLRDGSKYWQNSFMFWNLIELCLGILAASIPPMRPFVFSFRFSVRSALRKSSTRLEKFCKPRRFLEVGDGCEERRQHSPNKLEGCVKIVELSDSRSIEQSDSNRMPAYSSPHRDGGTWFDMKKRHLEDVAEMVEESDDVGDSGADTFWKGAGYPKLEIYWTQETFIEEEYTDSSIVVDDSATT